MRLEFFRDNAVLTKTKTHFPELTTRWRVRFSFSPFPTRCLASSTCSYGRATPGSSTRRPAGTPRSSPLSQDPGDSRSLRPSKHRQHQAMPTDARRYTQEKRGEEKCLFLGWAGHVRTLDCNTCRYSENSKPSITRWKVVFRKGWMWTSPDETDHVALQMSFSFALLCRCTLLSYLKRRRATCAAP